LGLVAVDDAKAEPPKFDEFKRTLSPPEHCSCAAAETLTAERVVAPAALICRTALAGECKKAATACTYAHLKPDDMKAMGVKKCGACDMPLKVERLLVLFFVLLHHLRTSCFVKDRCSFCLSTAAAACPLVRGKCGHNVHAHCASRKINCSLCFLPLDSVKWKVAAAAKSGTWPVTAAAPAEAGTRTVTVVAGGKVCDCIKLLLLT
jgi:hypothetical protein